MNPADYTWPVPAAADTARADILSAITERNQNRGDG